MTEDGLKNVHFRVPRTVWLRLRMLYPEKGAVQDTCARALVEYLDKKERERRERTAE